MLVLIIVGIIRSCWHTHSSRRLFHEVRGWYNFLPDILISQLAYFKIYVGALMIIVIHWKKFRFCIFSSKKSVIRLKPHMRDAFIVVQLHKEVQFELIDWLIDFCYLVYKLLPCINGSEPVSYRYLATSRLRNYQLYIFFEMLLQNAGSVTSIKIT